MTSRLTTKQPVTKSRDAKKMPDSRRWWMDHEGTVWINVGLTRRKPLTEAEHKAMMKAVDAFVPRMVN